MPAGPSKRRLALFVIAAATGLSVSKDARGAKVELDRAKVAKLKSAYLYNFTKFVKWPETSFRDGEEPIRIAVLGKDPLGPALDKAVRGKKVGSRPLVVERYRYAADAEAAERLKTDLPKNAQLLVAGAKPTDDPVVQNLRRAHVIYVGEDLNGHWNEILRLVDGASTLTVGETDDFPATGGMIGFVLVEGKIRFHINPGMSERAKLKINAKLLKLATIVK